MAPSRMIFFCRDWEEFSPSHNVQHNLVNLQPIGIQYQILSSIAGAECSRWPNNDTIIISSAVQVVFFLNLWLNYSYVATRKNDILFQASPDQRSCTLMLGWDCDSSPKMHVFQRNCWKPGMIPFLPTIMDVENYPSLEETNLAGTHFALGM